LPIYFELARDGRVTLETYTDPVEWTEIEAHAATLDTEVFDHATRRIYRIIDVSEFTRLPPNSLSQGLTFLKKMPAMSGELIIITRNPYVTVMAKIFKQAASSHSITLCKTLDEAWTIVDSMLEQETIELP